MENKNSPVKENNQHLVALENLDDWKVHEDDTDIRGWSIYAHGEKVGEIESLIANTNREKIQYVEVELDEKLNTYRDYAFRNTLEQDYHSFYGEDADLHIIVPIGMIEIDKENKKVLASPNLTATHFSNSPRFKNFKTSPVLPIQELIVAKYYTYDDENYQNDYEGEEYDMSKYRAYPDIPSGGFYDTDLFNNHRYLSRYRNSNPSMTAFKTGMPKR